MASNGGGDILSMPQMANIETSPPFESIGPHRFSLLNDPDPSDTQSVSRYFPVIVIAVVIGTLLTAKWVVLRTEQGDLLASRVFVGLVFASQLLLLFIGPLMKRSQNKSTPGDDQRPVGVPSDAVPAVVRMNRYDKALVRTSGWIWFDGDILSFRGVRFNLELRPSDFSPKAKLDNLALVKPAAVLMPKGVSPRSIVILPFEIERGLRKPSKQRLAELEVKLGTWRAAPRTARHSLLPPLRYGTFQPLTNKIWLGTCLASTLFAAMGFLVLAMFSQYFPQSNPWPFVLSLAAFAWMYPMMIVAANLEIKSIEKVIDRLRQSGAVELQ
jgi:hypothetical protein